jgi:hypothetical protein
MMMCRSKVNPSCRSSTSTEDSKTSSFLRKMSSFTDLKKSTRYMAQDNKTTGENSAGSKIKS